LLASLLEAKAVDGKRYEEEEEEEGRSTRRPHRRRRIFCLRRGKAYRRLCIGGREGGREGEEGEDRRLRFIMIIEVGRRSEDGREGGRTDFLVRRPICLAFRLFTFTELTLIFTTTTTLLPIHPPFHRRSSSFLARRRPRRPASSSSPPSSPSSSTALAAAPAAPASRRPTPSFSWWGREGRRRISRGRTGGRKGGRAVL